MNPKLLKLAEQAGFVFWQNESWKPKGATIDWAAQYDDEFKEYSKLLILECAKIARNYTLSKSGTGTNFDGTVFVEEAIKQAFGLGPDNTGTSTNEYQDLLSTEDCVLGALQAPGERSPHSPKTIPPQEC